MSVQLVIFPQNHQGYQYTAGASFPQLVTDGTQFMSAVNSNNFQIGISQQAITALTVNPPTTNWQRFYTDVGTEPQVIAGQIRLKGASSFI